MNSAERNQTEPGDSSLPTADTIAGGVMRKKENPLWLAKEDKHALFRAIEDLVTTGNDRNEVLQAIGLNRALYFDRIWFTQSAEEKFLAERKKVETANANGNGETSALDHSVKRTSRNAEEKLKAIDEVTRLRYREGHDFDVACRIVGITRLRFYDWSEDRANLVRIVRKKSGVKSASVSKVSPHSIEYHRDVPETVIAETLEQRRVILEKVNRLATAGLSLRLAARKMGITLDKYNHWVREDEAERTPKKSVFELFETYKKGGPDAEEARVAFIKHFTPTAQRMAAKYADRFKSTSAFKVDEQQLISVGLWEGVALHMDVFDPERGVHISTFFQQKIAQRMLDDLRRQDWIPRLERQVYREQVEQGRNFERTLGRPPADAQELHDFSGKKGEVRPLIERLPFQLSMDDARPNFKSGGEVSFDTLHDSLTPDRSNEEHFDTVETIAQSLIEKVHGQSREVLHLIYREGLTMKEAGIQLSLSESRVSQIHSAALDAVKHAVAESKF